MDPNNFSNSLEDAAANTIHELYFHLDMSFSRAHDVKDSFTSFLQQPVVNDFFNTLIGRMQSLGEHPENIAAFQSMIRELQTPFSHLQTHHQCLQSLKELKNYIPPEEILIGKIGGKEITLQFIPLRKTLQQFLSYLISLIVLWIT